MDTLKCKVVALSQNRRTQIGDIVKAYFINTDEVHWAYPNRNMQIDPIYKPQHLYLTSNREIQAGDWAICKTVSGKLLLFQANSADAPAKWNADPDYSKVEATTDPSLKLPLIPQSFVEKYVQMQGKIDEVLVEVWAPTVSSVIEVPVTSSYSEVKTRPDGTCIIHRYRLKDNWTREELKTALKAAFDAGEKYRLYLDKWATDTATEGIPDVQTVLDTMNFEAWFDQNY